MTLSCITFNKRFPYKSFFSYRCWKEILSDPHYSTMMTCDWPRYEFKISWIWSNVIFPVLLCLIKANRTERSLNLISHSIWVAGWFEGLSEWYRVSCKCKTNLIIKLELKWNCKNLWFRKPEMNKFLNSNFVAIDLN